VPASVQLLHRAREALQVDVDVGSSTSASSVVGLVAGAVKNLVIDMAVVLQVCIEQSL
jgi:Protein ENHANCED DISEASE RESISTANCE 2, C-terminal